MLKQAEGFIIRKIAGISYLLPYGQMTADLKKGFQINKTGEFLWNSLKTPKSRKELFEIFCKHCKTQACDVATLKTDFDNFIQTLLLHHVLLEDSSSSVIQKLALPHYYDINIAGISIRLMGNKKVFSKEFQSFICNCKNPDMTVEIRFEIPSYHHNGKVLLRNKELFILENEDGYTFLFPKAAQIEEAFLRKSDNLVTFYCIPPSDNPDFVMDLFHAIRFLFLYLAQKKEVFALHSASILYQGKAWLFSGHSGTGKSTHTRLWHELFDTPFINGDLNLISIKDEIPLVHGLPWCGTSKIYDTKSYPLGGIIFLKQEKFNQCIKLSQHEKILAITQHLISPTWTPDMSDYNLFFAEALAKKVPICKLLCTKEESAAHTMKTWIDNYFNFY